MSDLELLLEKVRTAEAGSALLDAEIYATVGGAPHTTKAGVRTVPLIMKGDPHEWPDYTRSIDAIVALIERELPGWSYDLTKADASACAELWLADCAGFVHAGYDYVKAIEAKTPALALCAAFLSAKIQTGSGE